MEALAEPSTNELVTVSPKPSAKSYLFKPGNKMAKGRPKGSRDFFAELISTLRTVEKQKGIPLFVHAWQQAYRDNRVLAMMLRRLVPDRVESDGSLGKVINVFFPGHWSASGSDSPVRVEPGYTASVPAASVPAKDI